MNDKLTSLDKFQIDCILTKSDNMCELDMVRIMVELWQWDVKPNKLCCAYHHYIKPQMEKEFFSGNYSEWLKVKIQNFTIEVIAPWFEKTYKEVFEGLQNEEPAKWSFEYVTDFNQYVSITLDEYLEKSDRPMSFLSQEEFDLYHTLHECYTQQNILSMEEIFEQGCPK